MSLYLRLIAYCLTIITLVGCASLNPNKSEDLKISYTPLESRGFNKDSDVTIGLALAGGGTKAANFSMGVLQGLSETGVMDNIDAISSVSGGGYAALWFYNRLLNSDDKDKISYRIAPFFEDCYPVRYNEKFFIDSENLSSDKSLNNLVCPNAKTYYPFKDQSNVKTDPYRYQNYVRGYQDIFSSGTDTFANPAFNMDVAGNKSRLSNDLIQLSIKTIAAIPINFIPNVLFDWEIPLSPSRAAYEKGILRTFEADVDSCENHECQDIRPEGKNDKLDKLTFARLKEAYKNGKAPLWIINTTAGESRQIFNFGEASPLMLTSYEMTPYGAGSGLYGYCDFLDGCKDKDNIQYEFKERLPGIEVSKAVIMSAAFFDEQQRSLGSRLNGITKPLQSLSTLNWGISRKNPRVSEAKQVVHKMLPWPFYYWHGYNEEDSVNIRFSDGGQSENLGAYALIRRKVSDIIISDHSQDRNGLMPDVCNLKNNLASEKLKQEERLYLYVPGLEDLNKVCEGNKALGYEIFNWNHPVLLGCVSKSEDGSTACTDANNLISRLYIIKPAIPSTDETYTVLGKYLEYAKSYTPESKDSNNITELQKCTNLKSNTPYKRQTDREDKWKFEDSISCELLGFWSINSKSGVGINKKDGHPHFPQHGTASLTLNSSNWIYGASKELGRYYSRQLAWFFLDQSGTSSKHDQLKEKFKNVMELQLNNQMKSRRE